MCRRSGRSPHPPGPRAQNGVTTPSVGDERGLLVQRGEEGRGVRGIVAREAVSSEWGRKRLAARSTSSKQVRTASTVARMPPAGFAETVTPLPWRGTSLELRRSRAAVASGPVGSQEARVTARVGAGSVVFFDVFFDDSGSSSRVDSAGAGSVTRNTGVARSSTTSTAGASAVTSGLARHWAEVPVSRGGSALVRSSMVGIPMPGLRRLAFARLVLGGGRWIVVAESDRLRRRLRAQR